MYEHWFAAVSFSEQDLHQPSSWTLDFVAASSFLNHPHVGSMLKIQLAVHDLLICAGRWQGQARRQRICARCQLQHVEDKFHVVLECQLDIDATCWVRICVLGAETLWVLICVCLEVRISVVDLHSRLALI